MFKKIWIIIGIILFICSFIAGYIIRGNNDKIRIVKETKTEFKYIKKAQTSKELQECYKSLIKIFASVKDDNWIEIIAKDNCKYAKKRIQVVPEQRKNFVFGIVGIDNYQVMYYRKFGNLLLGGGAGYPNNGYISAGYSF